MIAGISPGFHSSSGVLAGPLSSIHLHISGKLIIVRYGPRDAEQTASGRAVYC